MGGGMKPGISMDRNERPIGDCPSPPTFHARRSTARVLESRCIRDYHLRYQFSVISLQITCRATSRVIQLSQWESCSDPRCRDARVTSSVRDCDSSVTRSSPRASRKPWTNGRKSPWKSRIKFTVQSLVRDSGSWNRLILPCSIFMLVRTLALFLDKNVVFRLITLR